MKNPLDTVKKWFILSFLALALPGITLLGQEEGGDAGGGEDAGGGDAGGGGSAAEAAVTSGGTAQPAAAASGSVESNPVVTMIRAGVDFTIAKSTSIASIIAIARESGNLSTFASFVKENAAAGSDLNLIAKGVNNGLSLNSAGKMAKEMKDDPSKSFEDALGKQKIKDEYGDEDVPDDATIENIQKIKLLISPLGESDTTGNSDLYEAAKDVLDGSTGFTGTGFQDYLESAVTFANTVLTDVRITSKDHIPDGISVKSLTDSPQTLEFIRLLGKYGAIGSDGSALSDTLAGAFFGTDFASEAKSGTSLLGFLGTTTSDHLSLLENTLGARDLPELTLINKNGTPNKDATVFQVSMDNVTLAPGANITVGESSKTSTIVVEVLTKANSNEERKVAILGAAKDLTIAGDVTFTNTNTVEDHALVLGAADDVYFRSEYGKVDADYNNPPKLSVEYTGSNLGIGSNDTMRLINVDLKTGGNLALGTLDSLYIGTGSMGDTGITYSNGTNSNSKFEVGVEDNVYLYANNLISINGLEFGTGMDDIYMDAITIDLSNVTFPQNSDVMLRSRDGSMQFGPTNRAVGSVNFIENVKYGATAIESAGQFNGKDGHWDSTDLTLPNGKAAIKVRGFSN
jgi:hypothetical protein